MVFWGKVATAYETLQLSIGHQWVILSATNSLASDTSDYLLKYTNLMNGPSNGKLKHLLSSEREIESNRRRKREDGRERDGRKEQRVRINGPSYRVKTPKVQIDS